MNVNRVNIRTRDGQIGFVHMNHRLLSESALGGFEAHGRGAILVEVDQHDPDKEMVPLEFLPRARLAKLIADLDTAREGDLIRDYDPARELVIIFGWEEGARTIMDSYRVKQA